MMRISYFYLLLAGFLLTPGWANASAFGTKPEAVAMVERVLEKFHNDGAEKTFEAVSDQSTGAFHDRDLYPFIFDHLGVNVAHGARPALVGKTLLNLKDQDGKYLVREMIEISKSKGEGWINYKWPNPITNKIEDKTSFIKKMGNYFVGVGIYRFEPE